MRREMSMGKCVWMVSVLLVVLALCGCRTKYVSVPEYHTRYEVRRDSFVRMDTTFVRDSVVVVMRGDSVFTTKTRWRDRVRNVYQVRVDSFIKRDSVRVPYAVERRLSKWEQVRMDLGGIGIGAMVVMVVFVVVVWAVRR